MLKYIRLLRLPDQYLQIGAVLASAIFFQLDKTRVILWIISTTCISIVGFVVNEATDRHDTDKHSWNNVHMQSWRDVHMGIVWSIGIVLSIIGFYIALKLDVLNFAVVMYVFAIAYSAKPLRFKGVMVMDILSQLLVWWFIPFMALAWGKVEAWSLLYRAIMAGGFVWAGFYPYQIADFDADKKAQIYPTHVVLGVVASLRIGLAFGFIATFFYIFSPALWSLSWILPFSVFLVFCLFKYVKWIRSNSHSATIKSLQQYVLLFKPFTQLLVIYLAVVYFFF